MKKRIYIPEIDQVFDSISAASAALGVDAANVSKVLAGSRKTAGGYHFLNAGRRSSGRLPSIATLRKESRELLPPDPMQERRDELKNLINAANKQAKRLRKAGFGAFSSALEDIMALGDELGRTKSGYLKGSEGLIRSLSEAEVNKYIQAIQERKKRRSYTVGGAMAEAERLAANFGTTSSRIAEMSDALPVLFSVLHNVYKDKSSDQVVAEIDEFDDPEASSEQLIDKLGQLGDYYDKTEVIKDLFDQDLDMMKPFEPIRADIDSLLAAAEADAEIAQDLKPTIDEVNDLLFNGMTGVYDQNEVNRLISETVSNSLRHYGHLDED
jgi:ABC-type transporter Mla subunit MlaD